MSLDAWGPPMAGALGHESAWLQEREPIRPSQLPYLALCPAWRWGSDDDGAMARGSRMHAALATGEPATGEDADAIEWAREALARRLVELDPAGELVVQVEQSIPMPADLIAAGLAPTGRPDWLHAAPWRVVLLVDWKSGRGGSQGGARSLQLAAYALAAAEIYEASAVAVLVIYPDMRRDDLHVMATDDLRAARARILEVLREAQQPAPPRRIGAACRYCGHLATCPAVRDAVAVDVDQPVQLTPEILARAEVVRAWAGTIQALAHAELASGGTIPGWRLLETKRRQWREGTTPAEIATALSGIERLSRHGGGPVSPGDVTVPGDPVSPAGVEALVGRSRAVRDAIERFVTEKASTRLAREE